MDTGSARGGGAVARNGGRPGDQLARLLDRAENGPAAAAELAGVETALMHWCAVQSFRHTNGPPYRGERRTYRHSFLLPEGGVRLVWELEHDAGPGSAVRRLALTDPLEVAAAEWRADADLGHASPGTRPDPVPGWPPPGDSPPAPPPGPEESEPGFPRRRRDYTPDGSPDHAWRLLRRAANADAPGQEVRQRLLTSVGYVIGIVARRSTVVAGRHVSWSLYEHAFLLPDGTELSLWEIDHTKTPDGGPVCEVYGTREAALDTAVRRIEAG